MVQKYCIPKLLKKKNDRRRNCILWLFEINGAEHFKKGKIRMKCMATYL